MDDNKDRVPVALARQYEASSKGVRDAMTVAIYTMTRHKIVSVAFCADWDAMTDCALSVEEVAANGYDRS